MSEPSFSQRRLGALARPAALLLALGVTAAALVLPAACGVGDQFCTPDFKPNPESKNEKCPYGPVGGPDLPSVSCTVDFQKPDETQCPSWAAVHQILIDPARGNCNDGPCHSATARSDGLEVSTDPAAAYTALTAYQNDDFGPYLPAGADRSVRARSWFVCNLEGTAQGGSPMPKPNGLARDKGLDVVKAWFMCWLDNEQGYSAEGGLGIIPGEDVGAGGGGGGGGGGAGGAGGAGGGI